MIILFIYSLAILISLFLFSFVLAYYLSNFVDFIKENRKLRYLFSFSMGFLFIYSLLTTKVNFYGEKITLFAFFVNYFKDIIYSLFVLVFILFPLYLVPAIPSYILYKIIEKIYPKRLSKVISFSVYLLNFLFFFPYLLEIYQKYFMVFSSNDFVGYILLAINKYSINIRSLLFQNIREFLIILLLLIFLPEIILFFVSKFSKV